MQTYVMRLWVPDRPGALGAVASRVGAVGGDVVGIDILERGAGRAIDELVVELADETRLPLLVTEVQQVDGVDVEEIRPVAEALHDPRLDALETAAILVGAASTSEAVDALCEHAVRTIGSAWGAVVSVEDGQVIALQGDAPGVGWLVAFVTGSQSSARLAGGGGGPEDPGGGSGPKDVVWTPLPSAGLALVLGRHGHPFRARERRQAAALARIVDSRFRDLRARQSRSAHPSRPG